MYSFNCKRVMIKYFVVNLAQIPAKCVVVDIVVANIPTKFGMLFSSSWGSKIVGSIKLDLTYVTILVFGGEERQLHKESRFVKVVTRSERSNNTPLYGK